jgi:hypothetical protein
MRISSARAVPWLVVVLAAGTVGGFGARLEGSSYLDRVVRIAPWAGRTVAVPAAPPTTAFGAVTAAATAMRGPSAATPIATATLVEHSFRPEADAYVDAAQPGTNFGGNPALRVDGSPVVRSYLRFDVRGLDGPVARARLLFVVGGGHAEGYAVHRGLSDGWEELTITAANQPGFDPIPAGKSGALEAGGATQVDVTSLVRGDGPVTLVLMTTDAAALRGGSRESATRPILVVESWPGATASPTRTPTASPSPTPTATPTPTPTRTRTATPAHTPASFAAEADAHVDASSPSANRGTGAVLRADGSPVVRAYVRFDVWGLTGTVSRARLRLVAASRSGAGFAVHRAATDAWGERRITSGNQPGTAGPAVGASGRFAGGTTIDVDVTPLVTGDGPVTFVLITTGPTALALASRESGTAGPRLLVETR